MLQPKDTDWLNGYKNKTYIYAIYKNPISDLGTHADWKWEIEIYSSTVLMEIFNTLVTSTGRSFNQKIGKETQILNDTSDQWI